MWVRVQLQSVKYKDGRCEELFSKLWFESGWYFCNITESGWFWKTLSRKKVPSNHSLKSVHKQSYAYVLYNSCSQTFRSRKTPGTITHVFSCEYWKILRTALFDWILPVAAFASFITKLFSIGHLLTFSSWSKTQCVMISTTNTCRYAQSIFFIHY